MSVTIQTIATEVGLSKQAVSYALNGKTGQVSETTRLRVLAAAHAMGYRPNWRARSFARRRSQIIGLVYGRPAEYVERSQVVSVMVQRLAELDYELLLIPATGPVSHWAHKLRDGRVDGVLVTHPMPLGLDEFIAEHRLPAVLMNLFSDLDVSQVYFDDQSGARQAVDHLVALGHRRITYFSAPKNHGEHYSDVERREAYRAAMEEAGLEQHVELVQAEYDSYAAEISMGSGGKFPTAIVAYNDYDAVRLMRAFWRCGLRVPEQLSIVGFDDGPSARETIPPLTTVALPVAQLVPECIALLTAQIDAPDSDVSPAARVCLAENLVVRDSTAPPPGRESGGRVFLTPTSAALAAV